MSHEHWPAEVRGKLFAAPVTPFSSQGAPDTDACAHYYDAIIRSGADGLAVAVHSGRGPHLPLDTRRQLVLTAVRLGIPVITGVGGRNGLDNDDEWAGIAAQSGASALLVSPYPGTTADAVEQHRRLAAASGLPLIVFDLYSAPYDDATFSALISLPEVQGAKIARLSDAIACQERLEEVRSLGKLAITGEDRMFGPSLLWGADTALVGLGAASVGFSVAAWKAFREGDFDAFLRCSSRLDAFAKLTFCEPYDGYVQRMSWIAAEEGLIPPDACTDPFRPRLDPDERERLLDAWRALTAG